jgi:hypothetical protein
MNLIRKSAPQEPQGRTPARRRSRAARNRAEDHGAEASWLIIIRALLREDWRGVLATLLAFAILPIFSLLLESLQ